MYPLTASGNDIQTSSDRNIEREDSNRAIPSPWHGGAYTRSQHLVRVGRRGCPTNEHTPYLESDDRSDFGEIFFSIAVRQNLGEQIVYAGPSEQYNCTKEQYYPKNV